MRKLTALLVLIVMLSGVAYVSADGHLTPIKLQLQWVAQSQFAGYFAAVDQGRYDIVLIGIDKEGYWHTGPDLEGLTRGKEVRALAGPGESAGGALVSMALHHQGNLTSSTPQPKPAPQLDVIFPVLHGTFGEDGTIQGVLEMAGIPYVGCGVAASSLAMDKALARQVFAAAGIPQAPWMVLVPGLAISLAVLGFNLLGNGLQELLNPAGKGR